MCRGRHPRASVFSQQLCKVLIMYLPWRGLVSHLHTRNERVAWILVCQNTASLLHDASTVSCHLFIRLERYRYHDRQATFPSVSTAALIISWTSSAENFSPIVVLHRACHLPTPDVSRSIFANLVIALRLGLESRTQNRLLQYCFSRTDLINTQHQRPYMRRMSSSCSK